MDYKLSDICVCGHEFGDHDDTDEWCYECFNPPDGMPCAGFKLDNLIYIEREAVKRKLI